MTRGYRWSSLEDNMIVEVLQDFVEHGRPVMEAFESVSKQLSMLGYHRSSRAAYQRWLTDLEPIYGEAIGLKGTIPIRVQPIPVVDLISSPEEELSESSTDISSSTSDWSQSFQLVRSSTGDTLRESFGLLNELFSQLEEENRLLKEENERLKAQQTSLEMVQKKEKLFQQLEQKLKEVTFS